MHLVVFDIDGTLTDTNAVDEAVFLKTFKEIYGLESLSTDWSAYQHSTDSGIANEVIAKRLHRKASSEDLQKIQEVFGSFLTRAAQDEPASFREVPGASALLNYLKSSSQFEVSIATGAWEVSARIKLKSARIPYEDLPAAFANDAHDRADIIKRSIDRASRGRAFESITYVGDGVWDFKAAKALGIQFVGRNENSEKLRALGAKHIFKDYSQPHDLTGVILSLSYHG